MGRSDDWMAQFPGAVDRHLTSERSSSEDKVKVLLKTVCILMRKRKDLDGWVEKRILEE